MVNTRPISDLARDPGVLQDVAIGKPVFLTTEGERRYVLLDQADYESLTACVKSWAISRLLEEAEKDRRSGAEKGWRSLEEVEETLGICAAS